MRVSSHEIRKILIMKKIEKTAIIGMGALGMLYGERIFTNIGPDSVCYILDEKRMKEYESGKFTVNGIEIPFTFRKDTEMKPVDLLIVAVKGPGLDDAIRSMEKAIGPETVIISVMNGISSEQFIGEKYGFGNIIYTVAQGMDAVKFGNDLTFKNAGELRIGITPDGSPENLKCFEEFLDNAGIRYTEESDILKRLWGKLMLNVGINQSCMIHDLPFGGPTTRGTEANRTFISAMREVIAVANAEGIDIGETELNQYVSLIETLNPEGMPSMEQDRKNKRPSEVDLFAGTIIRYAEKHGLQVPVNQWIYQRVKEIEAEY